jgi:hypothetical protein
MGSVRQSVLEFDAAVRVPWRPLLAEASAGGSRRPPGLPAPGRTAQSAPRAALPGSGPRVTGHLRPVPDCPADPPVRAGGPAAGPAPVARATRRDPARPGGRPMPTRPTRGGVRRPAAPAPVRLTRRGRRLVAVLVLVAGVGGAVLGREVLAPDGGLRLAGESSVVVEPGDTVWSIAGEVARPGEDVRAVVHAIVALNGLEDAAVVSGQVLELP